MRATPARVLVVLAASGALAAAGLGVAPPALAGPPGHWTRLTTSTGIGSNSQPRLVRFGGKLQVVWEQDDPGDTESVRIRPVTLSGAAQPAHTVVSDWASVVSDPAPFIEGGKLLVAFGGIRTINSGEKYSGAMAYASSSNATQFSLGSEALSQTSDANASYGTGAVDNGGTPFVALALSPDSSLTLHSGIGPGFPSSVADTATTSLGGCCVYSSALARDPKTKDVWAAWYSNATDKGGIWVQQVAPFAKLSLARAPGSVLTSGPYKGGSTTPDQDVAMVARPGGGVWAAYAVGYPDATKIRLWHVGTSTYRDITAPDAQAVALSLGLNGRIWVAWSDPDTNTIKAVRSNKTVTRFGAVRSVTNPNAKADGSVYKLAVDGTKGPLDVVVNASVPGKSYDALYHTQIYAPLKVSLSRTSVKSSTGGSVTVTVTEAGSVIVGAKVSFGGVAVKTNSHGKATIKVKKHAAVGKKTVTVSLTYYVTTTETIRVT